MPEIGQEVDYTKRRTGSRARAGSVCRIEVCPKCGRKGEAGVMPFKTGDKLYVTHKAVFTGLSWSVTDFCMSPAPPAAHPE